MNDLFNANNGGLKPKSFWERPEGVTGQILGVLMMAGAAYVIYQALPFIIGLLRNTIYATLLGVVAVVLLFIVSDRRFWRLGKYLYMSAMRAITQVFVEIDPIGILKNHVGDLEFRLADMGRRITKLAGMIRECEQEIQQNKRAGDQHLKMMSAASKQGGKLEMALASREVGRIREVNLTYEDLLEKLRLLHRVLTKYQEVAQFLIADMRSEIKLKERKRDMMKQAHSAIASARTILKGDPDAREMFDLANEHLAADYAMKIGEIDDFARVSDGFMRSVDLQNGIYEAEAMELLTQWEQGAEAIVLGGAREIPAKPSLANNPASADAVKSIDWFKT
ncbi:hypothetical protein ACWA7J_09130 [Leptothrix sp. BB-4]